MEDEVAWARSLEYTISGVASIAIKASLELDLFGIIASFGPQAKVSASQIASRLRQQSPESSTVLDQMLRLMASHYLLTVCPGEGELLYGLAPASDHFSSDLTRGTLSFLHQLHNHRILLDVCHRMKDEVLDGGNQLKKRNEMTAYDYMKKDDEFRSLFVKAMAGVGSVVMPNIVRCYKGFEGLSSVVDVGGCNGEMIANIVSKYPSIKGVNFDLPSVIQLVPDRPGVKNVGGDMFKSVPKADAVILKSVLHNWNDDDCVKILKNCWSAIPDSGKVIVIDTVIPDVPDSSYQSQFIGAMSLLMTMFHTGKERSEKEFSMLGMKAGFKKCLLASKVFGVWSVLELNK